MARVVRFHELGDARVLRIDDLADEAPRPHEVRLKVAAIGLNRAEILWRMGRYLERPTLPARIGYDAAGVVDAVGDQVEHVKVGDRVATMPLFSQQHHGVYGETATVPADAVTLYPTHLTPGEATTFGVQYMTVYFGLNRVGRLDAGQWLLATAASSSTGIAAIEMGKAMGARVIATTRTAAKKAVLAERGADAVITTQEQDLAAAAEKITQGAGVDVAFDPVAGVMFEKIVQTMRPGGRIVIYGMLDSMPMTLDPLAVMLKCISVTGFQVFNFTGSATFAAHPDAIEQARQYIHAHLEDGSLRPLIARTFHGLEQIGEAQDFMMSNQQIGKIVVEL